MQNAEVDLGNLCNKSTLFYQLLSVLYKISNKISIKKSIVASKKAPTFSIVQMNNELLQIVGVLPVKSKIP